MTKRSVGKFDGSDAVVSKVAIVLAAVGLFIFAVALPALAAFGDAVRAWVPLPDGGTVTAPGGMAIEDAGRVLVRIDDASVGLRMAMLLPGFVIAGVGITALVFVWGLVSKVGRGSPFTREAVVGLRILSALLLLGPIVHWVVDGFVSAAVANAATGTDTTMFLAESGATQMLLVAAGLVFALVAEAYARGVSLEDDVEGLV